ncbi:MAG: GH3 auxin-responsive promoter family protein [Planctomyces sp.]
MRSIPVSNRIRAFLGGALRRSIRRQRNRFLKAARKDCRKVQQRTLSKLLHLNRETAFARDFGLHSGLSTSEFRKCVPVAGYELVRPYVERVSRGEHSALLGRKNHLRMFAVTSGTTAASKLIPVTDRFVRDYRRGWQSWGIGVYDRYPLMKQLNIVQISSSHRRFESEDGTACGNISGLVAAMQKRIVRSMYSLPSEIIDVSDSEAKRYLVLRYAAADPFVGMLITANPSTVVQLMEQLQIRTPDLIRDIHDGTITGAGLTSSEVRKFASVLRPDHLRARELESVFSSEGRLNPRSVWPRLAVLGVWTGGSASAYLPALRESFPGVSIRDHGLHASEGRMTMPLEEETSAGLLEVATHYFEFLPVREADAASPITLEAHELQEGQDYFILLTTSSGLCRYHIQDVVRCVGWHGSAPLLEFRHKGAHIASITGEKIAESQVVEAVRDASLQCGLTLRLYTLTPEWDESELPGYTLFFDSEVNRQTGQPAGDSERLAETLDQELCRRNLEYQEKRETGRLRPIRSVVVSSEQWNVFTAARISRSGGSPEQYKHPCLLPDPQFQRIFRSLSSTGRQ